MRRNIPPKITTPQPATAGFTPVQLAATRGGATAKSDPAPQPVAAPLASPPMVAGPQLVASPQGDWRARLKARVAAIEKTVPADIWSQL